MKLLRKYKLKHNLFIVSFFMIINLPLNMKVLYGQESSEIRDVRDISGNSYPGFRRT